MPETLEPSLEPSPEPSAAAVGPRVGPERLEACLARLVAEAPADARVAGLFGPGSALWWVDREAVVFLGAARALLLQLADPRVAAGVAAHSLALNDPLGRFHRTFGTVYPMVFGTADQALAAARRLHRRHEAVNGRLADGSPYAANDPSALAWVQATLVDSAVVARDLVLPPLSPGERDAYWGESRRFARLFGLDPADLPESWTAFRRWMAARLEDPFLHVSAEARTVADGLFRDGPFLLRPPRWYLALTASLLPDRLAAGFGLPDTPADRARARRVLALIRRVYPGLPATLRFVGPWHEAQGRLSGRTAPTAGTRLLNRLWIGRGSL